MNAIEDSYNNKCNDDSTTRYRSVQEKLRKVAKSFEALKSKKEDRGLDEIIAEQSCTELSQRMHEFYKTVSEFFDGKFVILPIDDIRLVRN